MSFQSAHVPFPNTLIKVYFHKRRNRFVAEAFSADENKRLLLHVPNSGRMNELLVPGAVGMALLDGTSNRKTAGTLLLIHYNKRWVSVDARIPNKLFAAAMKKNILRPFQHYFISKKEVAWGEGRLDFQLDSSTVQPSVCFIETKSCNLVENTYALFPDAPTMRGARHVHELAEAVKQGYRAALVWFVQRNDAKALLPHDEADPVFGAALRRAIVIGVETYAYLCDVTPSGITVIGEIPVHTEFFK